MRRLLLAFRWWVSATLLMLLPACARCGLQPEPGVKLVVPSMPTTLDWNHSDPTSWTNYPVLLATMKGLTSLDERHQVGPALAERWTRERTAEGHERYVFQLRKDVRWSDGLTPLVAEDFVVGWHRALQGQERGELADLLGADEVLRLQARGAGDAEVRAALQRVGVRALDPHTLEVILTRPRSYFLSRLANVYLFFPAPSRVLKDLTDEERRDYFDRPAEGHPLALGPYRVDRWDRAGERVRLVRNDASAFPVGEGAPAVLTMLRSEVGPALYERGRVDFVFIDSAVALRGKQPEDLQRRPLLSTYFLVFNTERTPLDDAEVRRGISAALDREALLKDLLPHARVASALFPPELLEPAAQGSAVQGSAVQGSAVEGSAVQGSAVQGSAVQEAAIQRAVDSARSSLSGAGGRTLRLVYRSGDGFVPETAIAERIASQLGARGIRVEVEPRSDFSDELRRRGPDGKRTWDLYLRRIGADYAHPNTFFTLFERTGNHQSGWENAAGGEPMRRFEALLNRADAEADSRTAATLYSSAERLLVEEQAVVAPLYYPDRYFRVRASLPGLSVSPFNFLSLSSLGHPAAPEAR